MDNKQPNAKMQARAVFHRKDPYLETQECEIEKVITLSDVEFDQFQQMLLNDYDFLRDNAELMRVENGVTHCLLVVGTNSDDGVLVNSEGSSYLYPQQLHQRPVPQYRPVDGRYARLLHCRFQHHGYGNRGSQALRHLRG